MAEQGALDDQNIKYVPIVYSCYGRSLQSTGKLQQLLANAAAIRYGLASSSFLLLRTRQRVGMAIWNGVAACVEATRQPLRGVEDLICGGDLSGTGGPWRTGAPIGLRTDQWPTQCEGRDEDGTSSEEDNGTMGVGVTLSFGGSAEGGIEKREAIIRWGLGKQNGR